MVVHDEPLLEIIMNHYQKCWYQHEQHIVDTVATHHYLLNLVINHPLNINHQITIINQHESIINHPLSTMN